MNLTNGIKSGAITGSSYFLTLTNGTYTFTVTIHGNNITETVKFYHWAYIASTVSPGNTNVTVNGRIITISSGAFNISVAQGTYHVKTYENGYNTYYNNFTVNSGNTRNLIIDLKQVSTPAVLTSMEI